MSGRKIKERVVSIPEVKKIMEDVKEKIEKIDTEEGISHFQEITYNYANKFAKMSEKDGAKLQKFLMDKYGIEEIYAINIVNIYPRTVPELRMILEKSIAGKALNENDLQDLLYQMEELIST
jgi:DNA-directed RNA polymerase subunit F